MATFKFKLRGSNPKKPQSIVLIIRYHSTYLVYPTGHKALQSDWVQDQERVKGSRELNRKLIRLKQSAEDIYDRLMLSNEMIDNSLLREQLNMENTPSRLKESIYSPYLTNFFSEFVENASTRVIPKLKRPVGAGNIKTYRTTLNHLIGFEKRIGKKIRFNQLNEKFHGSLLEYLGNELLLAPQTIGTIVKNIKMVSRFAKEKGVEVNEFVFSSGFYKPELKEDVKPLYLNEKEIKKVFEHDFGQNESLGNARDLLIIGLWTGLRISDFSRLTRNDIQGGFIRIKQRKTESPVVIPVHPQVQKILDKRNGDLPRRITDQRFNEYIKLVCKEVGFTEVVEGVKMEMIEGIGKRKKNGMYPRYELVTSHICRRSFATNLYGKIPTLTIMAITGHKSEKTFIHYIKITPDEHARNLAAFWSK